MKLKRRILSALLALIMLCVSFPAETLAMEAAGAGRLMKSFENESDTSDLSDLELRDFLWPDQAGKYHSEYQGAVPGEEYMLVVLDGLRKDLEGITLENVFEEILYIDQITARNSSTVFPAFVPSKSSSATVVISGTNLEPEIAAYIADREFEFLGYAADQSEEMLPTVLRLDKGSTAEDLKAMLPKSGYAVVSSPYTGKKYIPVTFAAAGAVTFDEAIENIVTMNIAIQDPSVPEEFANLLSPYVCAASVFDENAKPMRITAAKDKVVYNVGSTVGYSDIVVMAEYSDHSVRTITDYEISPASVDTSVIGEKEIRITYEGLTATIEVLVKDPIETFYQVIFDTVGGTLVDPMIVQDKVETLPDAPAKSGFVFTGWYYDILCTRQAEDGLAVNADMTLYAGWRAAGQVVLTGITTSLEQTVIEKGNVLQDYMVYVLAKYSDGTEKPVTGWTSDMSEIDWDVIGEKVLAVSYTENGITQSADAAFRIVAPDRAEMFEVTFDSGCETAVRAQTVLAGDCAFDPSASLAKEGYTFGGWIYEEELWDFASPVTKDMELKAVWVRSELIAAEGGNFLVYTEEERNYVYTGAAIASNPVVMDYNLNVLKKNRDYTLKYTNNKNVSTPGNPATVTVTGKGNYVGKITMTFVIEPRSLTETTGKLAAAFVQGKKGISPTPAIKYKKLSLKKGTDFAVSYEKIAAPGVSAGTTAEAPLTETGWYRATVEGKGNYKDQSVFEFRIGTSQMVNLSKASVKFDAGYSTPMYTGAPVSVSGQMHVLYKGTELIEGTDYILEYPEDYTSPGKVSVKISAVYDHEKYYGEKTADYTIKGIEIKGAAATLDYTKGIYDGTWQDSNKASVQLKVTSKNAQALSAAKGVTFAVGDVYALKEGEDYTALYKNAKYPGTAKIEIKGKGVFDGTVTKTFTIQKKPLTDYQISANVEKALQSKAGAIPKITVYDGGKLLEQGKDYTVKCSANTSVSEKAKALITGIGNYTGKLQYTYTIEKKDMASADVKAVAQSILLTDRLLSKPYNTLCKPVVKVWDNGKALKEGKDYTIDYQGAVRVSDIYVDLKDEGYLTIRGDGVNYKGEKRVYYTLGETDISKATIVIAKQFYSGKPIEFDLKTAEGKMQFVTATIGNAITLEPGRDFEIIEYKNNAKCTTASVTISGIGKFAGTKTVKFTIARCPLSGI